MRRGTRSASAPPSGASSAVGTKPAAATSPAHPAFPVDVVTRMPTPTVSIHVPMFETNAPAQSSAKRRCRNGANACERFTDVRRYPATPRADRPGGEDPEHQMLGRDHAVPVVRGDLVAAAATRERAHELEVGGAQRRHRLGGPERRRRVVVVHDGSRPCRRGRARCRATCRRTRSSAPPRRSRERRGRRVRRGCRVRAQWRRTRAVPRRARTRPPSPRRSVPCSFHSARSSSTLRSRRASTCRGRPRVGADAVEVARHDVGGDAREVGEQVVNRPFGCRRRDRVERDVVGVGHERVHAQTHTAVRITDLVHGAPSSRADARGYRGRSAVAWAPRRHGGPDQRMGCEDGNPQGGQPRGVGGRTRVQQLRDAHRRRRVAAGRRRRPRRRRQPLRHRRHLRQGPVRGVPRPGARAARRSEVVITTKVGMRSPRARPAGARRYITRRLRREPRPARHRLHRPLPPAPCPTPRRRSPRPSRRSPSWSPAGKVREIGCSNFTGAQLDEAEAVGEGARRPALRERAERLQPPQPRGRRRRAPGVRTTRRRAHALLPARQRRAHRQVPQGRGAPRGLAARGVGPDGRPVRQRREDATSSSASPEYADRPRAHAPRARALVAGRRADGRERHRRCHVARAGARQRRRHHRVDADRGRAGRGRRARRASAAEPEVAHHRRRHDRPRAGSARRRRRPGRAVGCSRSSTTSPSIRRARSSLRALDGVGVAGAARARRRRGCAIPPRCSRRSRRRRWRCGTVPRSAPAPSSCSRPTSGSSGRTRRWPSPRSEPASCRAGVARNA